MISHINELKKAIENIASALASSSGIYSRRLNDMMDAMSSSVSGLAVSQQKLTRNINHSVGLILSGDMVLTEELDAYISAAVLNDAYEGTIVETFEVSLTSSDGYSLHDLINIPGETGVYTSFANGSPPDSPTLNLYTFASLWGTDDEILDGDPEFINGVFSVAVTFDTGAGKVYTDGDSIEIDVKVSSDDKLLGWTVPLVTKIYYITA